MTGFLGILVWLATASAAAQATEVLPSWNDTASRRAIISFVVFDNDGTLWAEQPMYVQLA